MRATFRIVVIVAAVLLISSGSAQTEFDTGYLYLPDWYTASANGLRGPVKSVSIEHEWMEITEQELYDEQGRLRMVRVIRDGVSTTAETYQYDASGRLLSAYWHSGLDEVLGVERTYDAQGLRSERRSNWGVDPLIERVPSVEAVNRMPEVDYYTAFTLDEQGRIYEVVNIMMSERDRKYTLHYDAENRIVRLDLSFLEGTGPTIVFRYEYDDYGNVLSEASEPHLGAVRFEYEYDAHGSWIVRRMFRQIVPGSIFRETEVVERTISYY